MLNVPPHSPGQRIGLLGGSFDPPHTGHVHITMEALKRFRLDAVWWLVTPGNPLKTDAPAELARRLRAARTTIRDRRVHVTDLEHHLGTAYTAETVTLLRARCPRARFVWLMGADNLASFHRWRDWRVIAETMPLGVLARPGEQLRAGLSPAARALSFARISQSASGSLATGPAPRWCMLTGPMVGQSSSAIRAAGRWTP